MVVEVKALACELPATRGVPLSRWSCAELAREVTARGLVGEISGTTIWRWLTADAIRPWFQRSWIFPRDPAFAAKAGRVLDLYAGHFEGKRLGLQEFVLSADEKTSIQARCRCHPTLPPARARAMRVEHDTSGVGRWLTWPPGTYSGLESSAAVKRAAVSSPSAAWSTR